MTDEQTAKIEKMLERYDCEGNRIYQKQITVYNGKKSTEAYIFGGADNETIAQFVTVKDRRTGEQYTVTDDGVIINEKLASLLGRYKEGRYGNDSFVGNEASYCYGNRDMRKTTPITMCISRKSCTRSLAARKDCRITASSSTLKTATI